jgi:hypothetical protein
MTIRNYLDTEHPKLMGLLTEKNKIDISLEVEYFIVEYAIKLLKEQGEKK